MEFHETKFQRPIDRHLKSGVLKSIVHVIQHANFQFFMAYSDSYLEKLAIGDKYIHKASTSDLQLY